MSRLRGLVSGMGGLVVVLREVCPLLHYHQFVRISAYAPFDLELSQTFLASDAVEIEVARLLCITELKSVWETVREGSQLI
jgi:hypothetical protein